MCSDSETNLLIRNKWFVNAKHMRKYMHESCLNLNPALSWHINIATVFGKCMHSLINLENKVATPSGPYVHVYKKTIQNYHPHLANTCIFLTTNKTNLPPLWTTRFFFHQNNSKLPLFLANSCMFLETNKTYLRPRLDLCMWAHVEIQIRVLHHIVIVRNREEKRSHMSSVSGFGRHSSSTEVDECQPHQRLACGQSFCIELTCMWAEKGIWCRGHGGSLVPVISVRIHL